RNDNHFTKSVRGGNGVGATGINSAGGIQLTATDVNPERVQIDDTLLGASLGDFDVGDQISDVTGVLGYSFGNFEVLPTVAPTLVTATTNTLETTTLETGGGNLTIASYNVLNLDPNDADGDTDVADGRFAEIASQIVNNLAAPDIIGLQELQDGSGSISGDGVLSAADTAQLLIDEIVAAGGPEYAFFEVAPSTEGSTGGEPGGNIRVAYLYNPDRVDLVEDQSFALDAAALTAVGADPTTFDGTRTPLVATFEFGGETITLVNNHWTARGGSDPLFGAIQPIGIGGDTRRQEQAEAVNAFVDSLLAADPDANVAVLGDLNEFEFGAPLDFLQGTNGGGTQVLFNQAFDIDVTDDRFSFNFQGNSQLLDHILVTQDLDAVTSFDTLNINSLFSGSLASDHDPVLASISFFDNSVAGTDARDVIVTRGTDDFIEAFGGNDLIRTGEGDDFVDGGEGNNRIFTLQGDDTIVTGDGQDRIFSGIGNDEIDAGGARDRIFAGGGDDIIRAGDGSDIINGQSGNDIIFDGNGDDIVRGGEGDDMFFLGDGRDSIFVGSGADTIIAADMIGQNFVFGFDPNEDQLDFTAFGINNLAEASGITGTSRGLTFSFGADGSVVLPGLMLSDLTDANFVDGTAMGGAVTSTPAIDAPVASSVSAPIVLTDLSSDASQSTMEMVDLSSLADLEITTNPVFTGGDVPVVEVDGDFVTTPITPELPVFDDFI
ncbi:MAG: endonuclease/exonuclease/phosphatase family protein, partial [Pseudomonadota bacterium]